jgi:diaminopimelate decarboxylase
VETAAGIIARYFGTSEGELRIGQVPVSAIVSRYGSPLFIYDGHVLDQKWDLLRRTFPPDFAISYSVKANPNPALLKHFLAKGCGLEIASGGEFHIALSAGCPPEKILFAGPGKTVAELEFVLTKNIGEVHLESLLEVERVSAISRRLGRPAKVCVRVNPTGEAQGGAMRMGGKSTPFGVDEELLDVILDRVVTDPYIEFRGIHLFSGTQILDHAVLLRQYRCGIEIARRVAARITGPLKTVDFGGGLGIPYFADDQELNMEALSNGLVELMADTRQDPVFQGTQFMIEPGRYLVGEAGVFVSQVIDVKVSREKKFAIVDGGMNHHLAASGNLGQVIKRNFPFAVVNKLNEVPQENIDIVGPLCTPLDVLARNILVPSVTVGDLIGVFQSGAYARTASPLGFLSHPTPPELLVYNGEVRLIRRRGTYDDQLADVIPGMHCFKPVSA